MHLLLLSSSFVIYAATTSYSQFCLKVKMIYFIFLFLSAGKPFNVKARAARVQRAVIKVFHYSVDFLFCLFAVCGVNAVFLAKNVHRRNTVQNNFRQILCGKILDFFTAIFCIIFIIYFMLLV